MAKKGSRGNRRTRKMMNSQQGGNAPDSAWGYVMNTVGDGWTQFMDTFIGKIKEHFKDAFMGTFNETFKAYME